MKPSVKQFTLKLLNGFHPLIIWYSIGKLIMGFNFYKCTTSMDHTATSYPVSVSMGIGKEGGTTGARAPLVF